MTMIVVNINEAKARLSEYLDAVGKGERVLICKRNQPVAELRAVEHKRTTPRPIGLAKGTIKILPSFFDPMPDDWLDEWENGAIYPESKDTLPKRVAQSPAAYRVNRRPKRKR